MTVLSIFLSSLLAVLSPWQEGTLDIHLVSTGSGENSFVIMPDGTTMLIDAGVTGGNCFPDSTKSAASTLASYIKRVSPDKDKVDYFFLTHFHSDHMGLVSKAVPGKHGYRLGGATEFTEYMQLGKVVDRSWPNYDYPSAEYIKKYSRGFIEDYKNWVGYQTSRKGVKAERFEVGSRSQFVPVHSEVPGFEIYNIAGGGYISTGHGNLTRPLSAEDPALYDENMMSCAILVRYGDFTYYTGGDLPGSNSYIKTFKDGKAVSDIIKANPKVAFRNFEEQVADLTGPVTAMKLNHHGCPDATTPYALWKMTPQVLCVFGSESKQPSPTTLTRISDPQYTSAHKVFPTTDRARASNGDALWDKAVQACGHIVIRVTDGGSRYQVFVLDSKDPDFPVIYSSPVCESAPAPTDSDTALPRAASFGSFDKSFDRLFSATSEFCSTDELHSVIVVKDGKKIYERYDTGHDASELHSMWSASKTFTAVAVGFAIQDSLLTVNDRVISFFDDADLPSEKSEWLQKLSVRDLLTMSSGLGIDGIGKVRGGIWSNPAKEVLAAPMDSEPGSRYKYNSMNTYLLSQIVQKVTGLKTSEYLNRKLFRPLGITRWEWEESADGVTVGGWGLCTRTESLAKFGLFLLQKGFWDGRQLLDSKWIEELSSCHILQYDPAGTSREQLASYADDDWKQGYGYQVWRCTHNAYRADGAHGQLAIIIPEKNTVVAVNAQFHKGKQNFVRKVWEYVYPEL